MCISGATAPFVVIVAVTFIVPIQVVSLDEDDWYELSAQIDASDSRAPIESSMSTVNPTLSSSWLLAPALPSFIPPVLPSFMLGATCWQSSCLRNIHCCAGRHLGIRFCWHWWQPRSYGCSWCYQRDTLKNFSCKSIWCWCKWRLCCHFWCCHAKPVELHSQMIQVLSNWGMMKSWRMKLSQMRRLRKSTSGANKMQMDIIGSQNKKPSTFERLMDPWCLFLSSIELEKAKRCM